MQATYFDSASKFLELVHPALDKDEAANNLMYGLALLLERVPERYQRSPYRWPPLLAAVLDGSALACTALMTPPFNIIVFSPSPDKAGAFAFLAKDLRTRGWSMPGVLGPSADARAFAGAWSAETGAHYIPGMTERCYELRQVLPPPQPPGHMRLAVEDDIDLLTSWLYAFWREAMPGKIGADEEAQNTVEARVEDGDYFVWDDSGVVALAGKGRITPHGCTVGPVYTPPQFRSRGYATALTAALSQLLLDRGYQFVALFTDLSNPTSNRIYQKVGYHPLCDFNEYIFE